MSAVEVFAVGEHAFGAYAAATLGTVGVSLGVGVYVLAEERLSSESFQFFVLALLVAAALFGAAMSYSAPDDRAAVRWFRSAYVGAALVPPALYHLTVAVLGLPRGRLALAAAFWAGGLAVVVAGTGMIPYEVAGEPWGRAVHMGDRGVVLASWMAIVLVLALAEYVRVWRTADRPGDRVRAVHLLAGFGVGSIGAIDVLPAIGADLPPLGFLFTGLGLLIVARAIHRHRLAITPSFAARVVLDTMSDPVVACGPDGRIRVANPALDDVFGLRPAEVEGEPVEVLAGEDADAAAALRAVTDPAAREREEEIEIDRAGERRVVSLSASTLGRPGEARAGTVLIARDVTEEREAYEALRKSEEKFSTVFDVNPHALSIATLEGGRFVEVNRGFEELYRHPREDVLGRTAHDLRLWPDQADREKIAAPLRAGRGVRDEEVRLRARDGTILHALFSAETLEVGGRTCIVASVRDVTEQKRVEEELRRRALHDPLTGLPNRYLFEDRLDHAVRRADRAGTGVAVLFVDIDGFKRVNDSLGHSAGDDLLSMVGGRVEDTLRAADSVARVGGDEFAVLLEEVESADEASTAAERVLAALEEPFTVSETPVRITATVGIALGRERVEESPGVLLRHADVAMHRAKAHEGVDYEIFDPRVDTLATRRLQRENELRQALAEAQMELWYQPVVRLDDRSVIAVEALARWRHPDEGLLGPADFIPLAEETGLIVQLGRWVLGAACADVAAWREDDPGLADLAVSVNLSPREFYETDLPSAVEEALAEAGLPAGALRLEVTESVAMQGESRLRELRDLGARVVVDDFGTGYSSLAYLKDLTIDGLKVDRSFVAEIRESPRDAAIVDAVITLARRLDLDVVAEGVETTGQAEALREMGCSIAQGHLFARPAAGRGWEEELERSTEPG